MKRWAKSVGVDIEKIDLMSIDVGKIEEYLVDVLFKVFRFGDMKYFARIRMFNQVLDNVSYVDQGFSGYWEITDNKLFETK